MGVPPTVTSGMGVSQEEAWIQTCEKSKGVPPTVTSGMGMSQEETLLQTCEKSKVKATKKTARTGTSLTGWLVGWQLHT